MTWLHGAGLTEVGVQHQYLAALHWSLTQFTPATNNIVPGNARERLFASCLVVLALITFSTFVSSITGAMAKLAALQRQRVDEEKRLRDFLASKKISLWLGHRILASFRQWVAHRSTTTKPEDLPFLDQLPASEKMQLRTEMFQKYLTEHPVFFHVADYDMAALMNICNSAIAECSYYPGQDVFIAGDQASDMLMCLSGQMIYHSTQRKEPAPVGNDRYPWICEVALWSEWFHRGRLRPVTFSTLLRISSSSLQHIFRDRGGEGMDVAACMATYAAEFVRHANGLQESDDMVMDDVSFGREDAVAFLRETAQDAFAQGRPKLEGTASGGATATDMMFSFLKGGFLSVCTSFSS
mmetsp:Transcript_98024/g.315763  ORF Transcript_98024/g.315763 Transcript_98024/m.315763 type:complete len:353 (-) Transcript_98024:44-1102(-)